MSVRVATVVAYRELAHSIARCLVEPVETCGQVQRHSSAGSE
ncbi:MAG: hypothetical protein ACXVNM_00940 [Bacteroidia bacterium]